MQKMTKMLAKAGIQFFLFFVLASQLAFSNQNSTRHLTEEQALKFGTEAYIYGYPLVMMDMTRQVMTNVTVPLGMRSPINQLAHARDLPNATFKDVISPNEDTLYSGAWLNLASEPYVLHIPNMKKRYYLFGLVDAWTNVFADPGSRTVGAKEQTYLIVGPDWKGKLPAGFKTMKAPTNLVWIVGRIYCNGNPEDYLAVRQLQDQISLTPLSQYGIKDITIEKNKVNPTINMTIPVSQQVNALGAASFFKRLAELMQENPPPKQDANMVLQLRQLGIEPGKPFKLDKQPEEMARALEKAVRAGQREIGAHAASAGIYKDGWLYSMKTGKYGKDYLQRAFIATVRLGAYQPGDLIYMRSIAAQHGEALNGKKSYIIHFNKNTLPPVNGFWSLTMYNGELHFVDNGLNRYNITSNSPVQYQPDGSLDIYIQSAKPDNDKLANWLPAPDGPYVLLMRLYWPKQTVLQKKWIPSPVVEQALKIE